MTKHELNQKCSGTDGMQLLLTGTFDAMVVNVVCGPQGLGAEVYL